MGAGESAVKLDETRMRELFPKASKDLLPHLKRAMTRFDITAPVREAAFLAQVGYESAGMTRFVENLNYSAAGLQATWPSRFSAEQAMEYARKPQMIANKVYADRMGNGSEKSGDGWKYRGRGLIQITGRDNYEEIGDALQLPLLTTPELLEQEEYAALSAAIWWWKNGLNELADNGLFELITRRINGGYHGLAKRKELWNKAKEVLV
uniref:Putative glycoside hydrolase n=1 Tax=viral metagenome TaxID=1070528 RepID=A0A6M3M1A6_9ZZZZ